ncbi:c-type cytochrome biogenesis protein CcmI [Rhizobium oryzicola]|uniref:C-type cytochrome biogenesis protein CcmI n=1 Tax=Rhizobium oryzicola TaxID=1232668 RepID=A0ABT8ST42_9HYPH|nr:c-type cytochrome biogenesis protein CcmI [Rhizobium oryzicola]MDO1581578.1 c-type cytochrome biogenesis protein CcmI [Rhizobium oryzicola]
MVLWILFAFLTAGVAAILIAPMMKASRRLEDDREGEVAVYRDQLRELERDRQSGLIGADEAENARAEIGRRLLSAADAASKSGGDAATFRRHGLPAAFVVLCLPVVGLCLYLTLGSPGLPAQPLEARLANPGSNMALLVAKAERHLAENPNDGQGWDLLAPIYFRLQRYGDSELAYRNALRFLGETPARLAGLGETLVAASDGLVTEDARGLFERAIALDQGNMRARFYVGLGLEQAGRTADALRAFEALAKDSPPGAAWEQLVAQHIAKNGGTPKAAPLGNPTAEDVAAAQNMGQGDRQAMIRGMVESLSAKLADDPRNIEGWLRLVRSYKVLGEDEKARDALKAGLKAFPGPQPEAQRLLALAREIGVSLEGMTQ